MRKFTKTHNELRWLFPICASEERASKMFDEVEGHANYCFEMAHGPEGDAKKDFDKDDVIDAYMKGYSMAVQFFMSDFSHVLRPY